jgi:tRNA-splicing ligase RtcB
MIAVQTTLTAAELPDDLSGILSEIEREVPAGVGQGFDENFSIAKELHKLGSWVAPIEDRKHTAARQCGTLGSGNHFVEVCLDESDRVWVVLHSGSRGMGNRLAQYHIDVAKGIMKEYFITLPDPDLAYLVQGTLPFKAYINDLQWAQDYALLNRDRMMDAVLRVLDNALPQGCGEQNRINCHHNYTEMENHYGENMWITRKGAIRARKGDWGVIPGSMGTSSFIVRGLGNEASYTSASHGAGRTMSRKKARENLSIESFETAMEGKTWLNKKADKLLDEHPSAYKDIRQVMFNQADLVKVVFELKSILNYKGA